MDKNPTLLTLFYFKFGLYVVSKTITVLVIATVQGHKDLLTAVRYTVKVHVIIIIIILIIALYGFYSKNNY